MTSARTIRSEPQALLAAGSSRAESPVRRSTIPARETLPTPSVLHSKGSQHASQLPVGGSTDTPVRLIHYSPHENHIHLKALVPA
jgi:hypothetical protein